MLVAAKSNMARVRLLGRRQYFHSSSLKQEGADSSDVDFYLTVARFRAPASEQQHVLRALGAAIEILCSLITCYVRTCRGLAGPQSCSEAAGVSAGDTEVVLNLKMRSLASRRALVSRETA